MKFFISIGVIVLLIAGCTPKMGQDIIVEPQGTFRLESPKAEAIIGVLALLGLSNDKDLIHIGSDLKIINKWHSDVKIISLTYALSDEKGVITEGEAKTDLSRPLLVASGSEKILPLEFRIELKRLNANRLIGILESKRKLMVKGEAVLEVWGIRHTYPFEKEATKVVQKAIKGYL